MSTEELVCIDVPITMGEKLFRWSPIFMFGFAGVFFLGLGVTFLVMDGHTGFSIAMIGLGTILLTVIGFAIRVLRAGWRRAVIIRRDARLVRFENYRLHRPLNESWNPLGEFREVMEFPFHDLQEVEPAPGRGMYGLSARFSSGSIVFNADSAGYEAVRDALMQIAAENAARRGM